jgi:hypothetical protein
VRNVNITSPDSGGLNFYNKGANGFVDSLDMAFCYDYSGDVGFTNSYIVQKFLGAEDKFGFHHPKLDSTFQSNYNVWLENSSGTGVFQKPVDSAEQYQRLSHGVEDSPCWDFDNGSCGGGTYQDQINSAGNRSDLVSVGPFRDFEAGDTISVSFAFVFASKEDDGNPYTNNTLGQMKGIIEGAETAQTLYYGEDVNRNGKLDSAEDRDSNGKITRFKDINTSLPKFKRYAKVSFQNPVNEKLKIYFHSNRSEITSIQLIDMSGNVLRDWKYDKGHYFERNIENLPKGFYLLRFLKGLDTQNVEKLMKI